MPRFSSSKAVTARCLGRCLVQKSSLRLFYKHAGRSTALVAILSLHFSLTNYPIYPPSSSVNNDFVEVDELILEIADYKNDYADVAAEKLFRKCSTSWQAYQYLQDRVHDAWLPNSARQQLRRIIKRIQVQIHQSREYGWAYEYS